MQQLEPYYKEDSGVIYLGDVLNVLKEMPNESVDMVMTSPPYYGLRNYGVDGQIGLEQTFQEFLDKMLEVTAEIKRVLKKTGSFWLNFGDCYGGSGMDKCMLMQPERIAIKMIDQQDWILRNKIKWAKQVYLYKQKKTTGSVMPSSVKDRFNESGEELYFFVKSKKYYFDLDAVRLPNQVLGVTDFREDTYHLGGGFVRTPELYQNSKYRDKNYNKKYKAENENNNNAGIIRARKSNKNDIEINNPKGKNIPTIWQIALEPHNFQRELNINVDHFAIFPQALCEIPIKAGSPKDGIVMDIFSGSGTTLLVAKKLGRKFIGIDLNKEYCNIAIKRLQAVPQSLF